MSKVYIFIANAPARAGKDAISEVVKGKIEETTKNDYIKQEVTTASFKNVLFKYTSQLLPEYKIENFYDVADDGEYGGIKKEQPNSKLSLNKISKDYLLDYYSKTNLELNVSNDFIKHVDNINSKILEFKEKYKISGNDLSPRLALIFTSEYIIKPIYGEDFFGTVIAKEIEDIYKNNKDNKNNINIFITDSGFPAELKGIHNLSKKNKDIVPAILSIYRPGVDYDPSKDSRARLTKESLGKFGVDNIPIIRINNDKTLEDGANKTLSKIKDFKSGIIIPDKNIASLTFYDNVEGSQLQKVKHIMELLNQVKNNINHNLIINNINIIDKSITIELINKDGSDFNNQDIYLINRITDIYSPHNLNTLVKRNSAFSFDDKVSKNTNFTMSQKIKNLMENLNGIKDSKIHKLKIIEDSIIEFLNYKPKTDNVLKVFNQALLLKTNYLLNNLEHNLDVKVFEQNLKSINTLCKNIDNELKSINTSGIEKKEDTKVIYIKSKSITDLYATIDNFKKELPFDFEQLTRSNNINCVKTSNGYEIIIKNIPTPKIQFLSNLNNIEIKREASEKFITPQYDTKKVKDLEEINNNYKTIKNPQLQLISSKFIQNLNEFIKEPNVIRFKVLEEAKDKLKTHLEDDYGFECEEEDKVKIQEIIGKVNNFIETNIPVFQIQKESELNKITINH